VQHDHEGQARQLPAEQVREQQRVSRAADREELGDALDDTEHDGVEKSQLRTSRRA